MLHILHINRDAALSPFLGIRTALHVLHSPSPQWQITAPEGRRKALHTALPALISDSTPIDSQ